MNTTSNYNPIKLSHKTLMASIEQIRTMECPIAKYMKDKGFDPEGGGRLVMNSSMAFDIFGFIIAPDYVIINDKAMKHFAHPVLMHTYEHLLDVENLKPLFIRRESNDR